MIRALGFSENAFDTADVGRLCRGRERWIEPWEDPPSSSALVRTVVSGATFSDDGAADARRGLPWSGVEVHQLLEVLFPGRRLLAFMEDGHPADIPERAEGVEAYEGYRAGGRQELDLVRWHMDLGGAGQIPSLTGEGPLEEKVRGFLVPRSGADRALLLARMFELVGFSTLDSPPARYQPSAIPGLLEVADAVILLHRDKHGPAVGVYAREALPDLAGKLTRLCAEVAGPDVLVVPFAIPPMLARWDRALAELRAAWKGPGEFPVPVGRREPEHRRGRRRWRRDEDDALVPPSAEEEETVQPAAVEE